VKPAPYLWDYTIFGEMGGSPAAPDERMDFLIVKENGALSGFNRWTLNGGVFAGKPRLETILRQPQRRECRRKARL